MSEPKIPIQWKEPEISDKELKLLQIPISIISSYITWKIGIPLNTFKDLMGFWIISLAILILTNLLLSSLSTEYKKALTK